MGAGGVVYAGVGAWEGGRDREREGEVAGACEMGGEERGGWSGIERNRKGMDKLFNKMANIKQGPAQIQDCLVY